MKKVWFLLPLFLPVVIAVISHQASYLQLWIPLWQPVLAGAGSPPEWALWLGDGRIQNVIVASLIGVVLGWLARAPIAVSVLIGSASFVGVIALPIAWSLAVSEQLGTRLKAREFFASFVLILCVLGIIILGDETRDLLRGYFPGRFFDPNAQLVMCLSVPFVLVAVERLLVARRRARS